MSINPFSHVRLAAPMPGPAPAAPPLAASLHSATSSQVGGLQRIIQQNIRNSFNLLGTRNWIA
jgi:hypothetical protein